MRKLIIALMLMLPMMAAAQEVLTPEQQLEQAQKQLEDAQKALEAAKANAEKAKAVAEAKAKAEAESKRMLEEAERLKAEAAKLQAETEKIKAETQQAQATEQPAATEPAGEVQAVQEGWTAPAQVYKPKIKAKKPEVTRDGKVLKEDPKYLEGAVTEDEEGKVAFVLDVDANGKSAKELYQLMYAYLDTLTQDSHQVDETSRIVLVNQQEGVIACVMKEWLVFQSSFLSLDRSEFNYQLIATVSDNHLNMVMYRITYDYERGRSTGFHLPAEEVITDKYGLNKKKTDVARIFGKFRKATIDRKDQIFKQVTDIIK